MHLNKAIEIHNDLVNTGKGRMVSYLLDLRFSFSGNLTGRQHQKERKMSLHRVHNSQQISALQALAWPDDDVNLNQEAAIATVLACEDCLTEIRKTMHNAYFAEKAQSLCCDLANLLIKRSATSQLERASIAALKAHVATCTVCDIAEVVNQLQPSPY